MIIISIQDSPHGIILISSSLVVKWLRKVGVETPCEFIVFIAFFLINSHLSTIIFTLVKRLFWWNVIVSVEAGAHDVIVLVSALVSDGLIKFWVVVFPLCLAHIVLAFVRLSVLDPNGSSIRWRSSWWR